MHQIVKRHRLEALREIIQRHIAQQPEPSTVTLFRSITCPTFSSIKAWQFSSCGAHALAHRRARDQRPTEPAISRGLRREEVERRR